MLTQKMEVYPMTKFFPALRYLPIMLCLFVVSAHAMGKVELNAKVKATLTKFYHEVPAGKALAKKSVGMLVFPEVFKAGIGIGGEYGEGALLIHHRTVDYYRVNSTCKCTTS